MTTPRILLLSSTFAVSALIAGCGVTAEVDADAEFPLPGGGKVTVEARVGVNGDKTLDVEATKPLCVELCFSGSDGADLGCVTLELPGSAQVPRGAVRVEGSEVDCPDGGDDPAHIGGSQPRLAVPHPKTQWELFGTNIVPAADGSTNVSYSFLVEAPSLEQAKARRDAVLAGGIGTPVGPGFDVIFYNESEAEFDNFGVPTGVRMRQAEVGDDFVSYRLTVNDQTFAELGSTGNLLHYAASNGWNVIETFVPTSAFDTTPGAYDNQAEADWTTVETTSAWGAMQRVSAN